MYHWNIWWWRPLIYFHVFNTLRPKQDGRHFPDDIFQCIFLNENVWISIRISLRFVPKGLINNIEALVQILAWCPPGDKPLSGPMMVNLLMHICVTQPQWVKGHCITWWHHDIKMLLHYWPFVRGIHWSPVLIFCLLCVRTHCWSNS